jgi:hypothetical protein
MWATTVISMYICNCPKQTIAHLPNLVTLFLKKNSVKELAKPDLS